MKVELNTLNFKGTLPNKPIKKLTPCINKTIEEHKGVLKEFDMNIVNEIKNLFDSAHSTIKSIAKSCNTRSTIKNGYERLKTGVAGSRILEFKNIGSSGEDISVNLRIDRGKTQKTIIIIGDTQLIINPKGQIEKNPSMRFIRNNSGRGKGEIVSYYTQQEIDAINPTNQFFALKNELKKYIDYIKSRQAEIYAIRNKKADNIVGSLDKYSDLINDVTNEFNYFKTYINKLSEKAIDKDVFRILNKIKTFPSQNSIMVKNVTPDGRSLYLIYSMINKQPAMKLFVMDYNNQKIDKSFIIYKNKLAKFYPKKVNEKPSHLEYDFHYFTQDEIDNSDLKYYLTILKNKLCTVNDNLEQEIAEKHKK